MKLRSRYNLNKIIFAGITLLLVQMNCVDNLSSNDPRILPVLNIMSGNLNPLLRGVGVIPSNIGVSPPQITKVEANLASGVGGSTSKIYLYSVQLNGCENAPSKIDKIDEAATGAAGSWSVKYDLKPGEVVGATEFLDGKESGLGNLMVSSETIILTDNLKDIDGTQFNVGQKVFLKGSSIPGACVILENQDLQIGRVDHASADSNGKWTIEVPVKEGISKYKVYVVGFDDKYNEFTIDGSQPIMQWPLGAYQDEKYVPDYGWKITAWYGPNAYHITRKDLTNFHDGLDIDTTTGIPVNAIAGGWVFYAQFSDIPNSGGNSVYIDHGSWGSFYLHLDSITIVSDGKSRCYDSPIRVEQGQEIGTTGATGLEPDKNGRLPDHLHISVFSWIEDTRTICSKFKPWPVSGFGKLININPSMDTILGNGVNSDVRIGKCVSKSNYWIGGQEFWNKIYFDNNFDGTAFPANKLQDEKCEIPPPPKQ